MGGMNVNSQVNNVYTSANAPAGNVEAMKKKLAEAEANHFEGQEKIQPNNFKDGSEVSEQSTSISKNLKEASQEVKEMLKNPNAFTDCFPTRTKGPKNQLEDGGAKQAEPLTNEKLEKLKNLSQNEHSNPKGQINSLSNSVNNTMVNATGMKGEISPEHMEQKLNKLAEAAQNGSTLTPMSAEEAAHMQEVFKKLK